MHAKNASLFWMRILIPPPISPKAYTIIPWIYSVGMDWALQISIQNITLPLHCNAVVIF